MSSTENPTIDWANITAIEVVAPRHRGRTVEAVTVTVAIDPDPTSLADQAHYEHVELPRGATWDVVLERVSDRLVALGAPSRPTWAEGPTWVLEDCGCTWQYRSIRLASPPPTP